MFNNITAARHSANACRSPAIEGLGWRYFLRTRQEAGDRVTVRLLRERRGKVVLVAERVAKEAKK